MPRGIYSLKPFPVNLWLKGASRVARKKSAATAAAADASAERPDMMVTRSLRVLRPELL